MSSPRAATSVATTACTLPRFRAARARSRCGWASPPWMQLARMLFCSSRARMSSTVLFMFAKTRVFATFPLPSVTSSMERRRASNLSPLAASTKRCSTSAFMEPTRPTEIWMYPGSRKSSAMSCISWGNVAENIVVCRSSSPSPGSGMPWSSMILLICGSKPMSSILSASSSVKCLTFSIVRTPRFKKSSRRPGVQMAMSHPSASSLS
mmetsp:Transcript_37875/g.109175  ORF Transcript_37875/g.109175 Transcript_37875/m.109175 type:complete len:208 (-) Transcript_37875:756-1379(-)